MALLSVRVETQEHPEQQEQSEVTEVLEDKPHLILRKLSQEEEVVVEAVQSQVQQEEEAEVEGVQRQEPRELQHLV